jgi:hypothetical protein
MMVVAVGLHPVAEPHLALSQKSGIPSASVSEQAHVELSREPAAHVPLTV